VNGHDEDNDWLTTSDSCFVPAETALKAIPAPALAELSENLNQSDDVIERRGRVHYALEALKRLGTFFKKVDGSSSGGKGSGGKKTKPQREPYKKPETPDGWRKLVHKNGISPEEAKRAGDWQKAKYDEAIQAVMTGKSSKSPFDPKFYGNYKCAARVGRIVRRWGHETTNAVIAAGTIAVLDIKGKPDNLGLPRKVAKNNKIIGHKPRSEMVKDLYEGFELLKKTKAG
jgi:hypothetical protein